MIYKGEFKDINGKDYRVEITTSSGNQTQSVTLGESPFVTEMGTGDKTIYVPAKYQTATVQIITPDYNFDIYSAKAQGSKVVLYNSDNSVAWTGYVTPNLYDMGFVEEREQIDIECIDALSTLQYIKYQTNNKSVVSFLNIIRKVLKSCNAYTGFYVTDNVQVTKDANDTILDKLFISENNFFDTKSDDETDEDVAWTMKDILEEICQYLGVTAVADGDSVYFLDYDAIKTGNTTYFYYSLSNSNVPTRVTKQHTKKITASDYSDTNGSLSLDNVYNKVTVTNSLYTFDNIIPDTFDELENITKDSDDTLTTSTNAKNGMWGEVVQSPIGEVNGENNNLLVMIDRVYNPQKKEYGDFNAVFVKYFNNPNFRFYKYDTSGADITDNIERINYTDTKSMFGATIAKFDVTKLDEQQDSYWIPMAYEVFFGITDKRERAEKLDEILTENDKTSVNFSNYIMMLNPSTNHIDNSDITKYPYFETLVTNAAALFGGKNAYLVISGSVNFHYFDDDPYPIPQGEADIREGRFAIDDGQAYLLAKLQWGNLYWDGETWKNTTQTFKIPFIKEGTDKEERRADYVMFKDNSIANTVNWRVGTNEKGYLIKMLNNSVVTGLPTLTVYKPFDPNYHSTKSGDNKGQHYKMNCVFLKNFQIKAIVGDPTFSGDSETDTVYTNEIDNSFVSELDEIKFKICTWDNKKPNYNAVAYKSGNTFTYLDKTYNKSCYSGEQSWSSSDDEAPSAANGLRQEEHLIYKLVNQYSTPSIILKLSLRNDNKIYGCYTDTTLTNRDFIVDSINVDYKLSKQDIKLIEKK